MQNAQEPINALRSWQYPEKIEKVVLQLVTAFDISKFSKNFAQAALVSGPMQAYIIPVNAVFYGWIQNVTTYDKDKCARVKSLVI